MTTGSLSPADAPPGGGTTPVIRGVALICTLYNEVESIGEFLESVYALRSHPEEFVIVDGGSTDGTNEAIDAAVRRRQTAMRVRHLIRPDCNRSVTVGAISRGRNVAVGETTCRVIAVTDAGCRLDPEWLDRIVTPLVEGEADVAGGWYLPLVRTRLERCIGRTWIEPPGAVDPDSFLPSSRSIAFMRTAWESVRGYPEYTYCAEDTLFDLALRENGCRFAYVPDAIVHWRMPPTLRSLSAVVFKYAYWEGRNRIMAPSMLKTSIKVAMSVLLLILSVFHHPAWLGAFAVWMGALAGRHLPRGNSGFGSIADFPCMMVVKAMTDSVYLAGHLRGRFAPPTRGEHPA